jgi:hypothetical protein
MIRVSTRNKEDQDADEVKYPAKVTAREVNYVVQYRIPDREFELSHFRPDWLNKWCRRSKHAKLEDALWNYRKEKRAYPKWDYRIVDADGKPVDICETCEEPKLGLLCRRSFFDFITGELCHG